MLGKLDITPEELKKMYEPLHCNETRQLNSNRMLKELISSLLTPFNKYALWYPLNYIESYDKKAKMPAKYATVFDKNCAELIEVLSKVCMGEKDAKNWCELMEKKRIIKQ